MPNDGGAGTIGFDYFLTLTELIGLADSKTYISAKILTLSEALTLSDTSRKSINLILEEAFTLSDTTRKHTDKKLLEDLKLSDSYSRGQSHIREFTEALVLVDSLLASNKYEVTLDENITLDDDVNSVILFSKTFTEEVGVSDTVSKIVSITKSDAFSLSDELQFGGLNLNDRIELSDSISFSITKSFSESFELKDYLNIVLNGTHHFKTLGDDLSVSDVLSKEHYTETIGGVERPFIWRITSASSPPKMASVDGTPKIRYVGGYRGA